MSDMDIIKLIVNFIMKLIALFKKSDDTVVEEEKRTDKSVTF